jgi:hypothetical protein
MVLKWIFFIFICTNNQNKKRYEKIYFFDRLKKNQKTTEMNINEKIITLGKLTIDEKDFKEFVKYINDFYGTKGVYPNKYGKNLSPRDILKAIASVAKSKPNHEWDWDSLDRELVRDELISMKVFDYPTQESAIKEISQVGELYESVNEDFKSVVGKKVYSDGKGKLFFGYEKEDDSVHLVDYKTWKGLSFKDVSKGDTNKERVINAIVKGQKQFNKKVDYNMWAKKTNPSFEEKMDWFIKNGWISNINKGGIKESVESVNEGQLNVGDVITVQAGTTLQKMNGLDDKWKVIKKDNSTYTLQKVGSSMKVRHLQSKVDYLIARPGQSQLPFIVESVNESELKPKKLTQLKKGEKFVFNNNPYEFVELYTDIPNAAKVKQEDGKTSVVSFGGGVVNKNTKGGFSDYLKQGGRVWDNVNPTDSPSVNEDIEPQTKKIASLTGTRADAVKQFVSANALNITKLLKFIEKGKLSDRMDFATAIAGKPGNPIQNKIIKMFQESVNEARGVGTIQKEYAKTLELMKQHLELYKKSKGTPEEKKHIKHLSDLTNKKKALEKELDDKVSGMYKNAEYQGPKE